MRGFLLRLRQLRRVVWGVDWCASRNRNLTTHGSLFRRAVTLGKILCAVQLRESEDEAVAHLLAASRGATGGGGAHPAHPAAFTAELPQGAPPAAQAPRKSVSFAANAQESGGAGAGASGAGGHGAPAASAAALSGLEETVRVGRRETRCFPYLLRSCCAQ